MRKYALICLWICTSCGGDDPPAKPAREVGREGADADDAGAKSLTDVHFGMIAFFLEVERGLRLNCPCLAQRGDYESTQACLDAVSFKPDWQACVAGVAQPDEDADL